MTAPCHHVPSIARNATGLVSSCLLLGACHPRTAPAPIAAIMACPAPALDVSGWAAVSDSSGVTYRLPPGFRRQPDDGLAHHSWQYESASFGDLAIGFIRSREFWLTLRRAPSPGMNEMSECIDSIPGRQILVQAWRTTGGIFRNGRRADRYDVMALVSIDPSITLYLTGGGSDRRFQAMLLAIARTVRLSGTGSPRDAGAGARGARRSAAIRPGTK